MPLLILAAPCVVYVPYYASIWHEPVWLYQRRSTPGTELLAALGGCWWDGATGTCRSFTTRSGTENWYLKRAIEKHGVVCTYVLREPGTSALPHPAIAGVRLGERAGHFIAILGETPTHYIVGEPLSGRRLLRKDRMNRSGYEFTGFFMVLRKAEATKPSSR